MNLGNIGWRITNARRIAERLDSQVKFRCTAELYAELTSAASARGIPIAELLRLYATWGLETDRKQNRA